MKTVRTNSTFSNLARIHADGENITQADLSSIAYVVLNADDGTTYNAGGSVTVSAAVFDTLQTDGRWTEDDTGYNFRHDVPHTIITAVGQYVFKYTFTLSGGSQFVTTAEVQAVNVTTPI